MIQHLCPLLLIWALGCVEGASDATPSEGRPVHRRTASADVVVASRPTAGSVLRLVLDGVDAEPSVRAPERVAAIRWLFVDLTAQDAMLAAEDRRVVVPRSFPSREALDGWMETLGARWRRIDEGQLRFTGAFSDETRPVTSLEAALLQPPERHEGARIDAERVEAVARETIRGGAAWIVVGDVDVDAVVARVDASFLGLSSPWPDAPSQTSPPRAVVRRRGDGPSERASSAFSWSVRGLTPGRLDAVARFAERVDRTGAGTYLTATGPCRGVPLDCAAAWDRRLRDAVPDEARRVHWLREPDVLADALVGAWSAGRPVAEVLAPTGGAPRGASEWIVGSSVDPVPEPPSCELRAPLEVVASDGGRVVEGIQRLDDTFEVELTWPVGWLDEPSVCTVANAWSFARDDALPVRCAARSTSVVVAGWSRDLDATLDRVQRVLQHAPEVRPLHAFDASAGRRREAREWSALFGRTVAPSTAVPTPTEVAALLARLGPPRVRFVGAAPDATLAARTRWGSAPPTPAGPLLRRVEGAATVHLWPSHETEVAVAFVGTVGPPTPAELARQRLVRVWLAAVAQGGLDGEGAQPTVSVASETVGDALVTWVRLSGGSVDPARVRTLAHDAREPIGAERWAGLVTQAAHPDDPPCERPLLYEVRSVAEEIAQGVTRAEIAAALARLEREAFETSLRGLRVGAVVVHGPPDASGGFEGFEGFDVVRHDR